jgi:hypothetical protein
MIALIGTHSVVMMMEGGRKRLTGVAEAAGIDRPILVGRAQLPRRRRSSDYLQPHVVACCWSHIHKRLSYRPLRAVASDPDGMA